MTLDADSTQFTILTSGQMSSMRTVRAVVSARLVNSEI